MSAREKGGKRKKKKRKEKKIKDNISWISERY